MGQPNGEAGEQVEFEVDAHVYPSGRRGGDYALLGGSQSDPLAAGFLTKLEQQINREFGHVSRRFPDVFAPGRPGAIQRSLGVSLVREEAPLGCTDLVSLWRSSPVWLVGNWCCLDGMEHSY